MKIKIATPNKNEFAKFEISFNKEDFNLIVDTAVDGYICNEYDSDLYNHKSVLNAVSKCEIFKEKVISEILTRFNEILPDFAFEDQGLGLPWEDSPVCQKIEQDIRAKRTKKEDTKEVKDAKRLLEKSGYKVLKG